MGALFSPLETILEGDKRIVNIVINKGYEKDQMVLSWINAALSETTIPYTVGVKSSREA